MYGLDNGGDFQGRFPRFEILQVAAADRRIYRPAWEKWRRACARHERARLEASQEQSMESVGKLRGENSRLCFTLMHTQTHVDTVRTLDRLPYISRTCLDDRVRVQTRLETRGRGEERLARKIALTAIAFDCRFPDSVA